MMGPLVEGSLETNSPNLRHARAGGYVRYRSPFFNFNVDVDASVFNSRQFTFLTKERAVWGARFDGSAELIFGGYAAVQLRLLLANNRPELLSLMPSAAKEFEAQVGISLVFHN